MTTPTTEEKLFAIAAAAAKMVKNGDLGKAMESLNLMAAVADEQAMDKAKGILETLHAQQPGGPGDIEDHFQSVKLDMSTSDDDQLDIDTSRFTHEEMLFLLVVLLGGNMRAMATEEDKEDRKKNSANITRLINMILRWVTKEDWEKAHAMIEGKEPPEDKWETYLGA